MEFTILSAHAGNSPYYKWSRDGKVEVLDNPLRTDNDTNERLIQSYSNLIDNKESREIKQKNQRNLPKTQRLRIRVSLKVVKCMTKFVAYHTVFLPD